MGAIDSAPMACSRLFPWQREKVDTSRGEVFSELSRAHAKTPRVQLVEQFGVSGGPGEGSVGQEVVLVGRQMEPRSGEAPAPAIEA